jgi:hypothetical protein
VSPEPLRDGFSGVGTDGFSRVRTGSRPRIMTTLRNLVTAYYPAIGAAPRCSTLTFPTQASAQIPKASAYKLAGPSATPERIPVRG